MPAKKTKPVVGWREWVQLPEFGVAAVKAKIDTGARSSAIHAYKIRPFDKDGQPWLRFELHPEQHKKHPQVTCEAELLERRSVKSSNGKSELRYVVKTSLKVGDHHFPIQLTLTNRDAMGFRMLLGRRDLRRRFMVDPGRSFVQGKDRPTLDEETI